MPYSITNFPEEFGTIPRVTNLQVSPNLKGLGEFAVTSDAGTPARNAADAKPSKPAGKSARITPAAPPDLAIPARWGYSGQVGVTMPGPGKVTPGTRGEGYLDIHLNATTRWKDVPEPVWNYTLGGYRVLKKWLSYRESALLGAPSPPTKPNTSPTTSAASPASSPCTRSWMRTTGRVFDLFPRASTLRP